MIVVTGTGIVSAIGTNTSEVANALLEDVSGIAPVSFLQTQHRQMPVGEVKLSNEQLAQRLGIVSTGNTSRTMLLGTLALREALAMAGIKDDELEGVALVSGTTVADMDCAEQRFDPRNDHVALGDCGRSTEDMAQHVGRFGFVTTCSTACSSAANAFILGANLLRSGRFKQVVVGGTETLRRHACRFKPGRGSCFCGARDGRTCCSTRGKSNGPTKRMGQCLRRFSPNSLVG